MTSPDHLIRVVPRPPTDVLKWLSFLAASPLDEQAVRTIATSLASEGPLAALTHIEAGRALANLAPLDDVGRANCWVAMRTSIHRMEQTTGESKIALGVLHRLDPVRVPAGATHPVVTERSLKDWWSVRDLVADLAGLPPTSRRDRRATRAALAGGRLLRPDVRNRVAHAPIIRASVFALLSGMERTGVDEVAASLEWLATGEATPVSLDREIERMWLGAELHRLADALRVAPDPS